MKNKDCIQASKQVTSDIVERVVDINNLLNPVTLKSSIHPLIANAMFDREREILQEERFLTIIKISKAIENEDLLLSIIKSLGYELTAKRL